MKTQRSALLGLVLGLAVFGAACEDKTEVVIPPNPDPPIVVTVTPQQLALAVGQSATLAAAVTGGNATTAKTVTWSTSSAAVATVDANGNVNAVGAGVATIIATSTADAGAKGAAAVTVGAAAIPSVSIKSITFGATTVPVALNNVFGQIDITLNLDVPTGAQISALRTYVNNVKVCEQTFSGGAEIGETEEINEAAEIICSVNTAAYTGTVGTDAQATITFPNGPGYKIRTEIVDPTGTTTAQIESADLIFNNPSFIVAQKVAPTHCVTGTPLAGATFWCEGDIVANFLPVNFSTNANDAVNSITLTASTGATATDAAAGWSATLQKASSPGASSIAGVEGAVGLFVTSTTVGGQTGPTCINPDPVLNATGAVCSVVNANTWVLATGGLPSTAFLVDNVAPTVTWFDMTPDSIRGLACAPNWPGITTPNACYISELFGFNTTQNVYPNASSADRFFTMADAGVGTPTVTFKAGPSAALVDVTTGGDLAETVTSNEYVAQATTKDALDNVRSVYASSSSAGVSLGGGWTTSLSAAQTFGVDTTAPSPGPVVGVADKSTNPAALVPAWTYGPAIDAGVGPSGFLPNPYRVILERHMPTPTNPTVTCFNPDNAINLAVTVACKTSGGTDIYRADDGLVDAPTGGSAAVGAAGYWNVRVKVVDAAWPGNESVETSRVTLNDVTAPVVGGIASPSSLVGGQAAAFSAGLSDNVDLGTLSPFLTYTGGATFQWPVVTLGAYGFADGMVGSAVGMFNIASFVRSIEGTTAAGRANTAIAVANDVTFDVMDVALNLATGNQVINAAVLFGAGGIIPALGTAAPGVPAVDSATFNPVNVLHGNFLHLAPNPAQVCRGTASACGSTPPASTVLRATMTGPNATFTNPFVMVQFYYIDPVDSRYYLIGTGTPAASDNTVTSTRTWTYSYTWTVTGLTDSTGAALVNAALPIVAVGITSSGSAIISLPGSPQTIDVTAT